MALYRSEGIVLRNRNLGEADKIVVLFTPREGKIEAVARGARRARSRLLGVTQPFVHGDYLLFRNRQLDTLSQGQIVQPFRALREDLPRLAHASAAAELVDLLAPAGEPAERMFQLLLATQAAFATAAEEQLRSVLWAFVLKLVSLAGFKPRLDACAVCNLDPSPEAHFSCTFGGLVCPRCAAQDGAAFWLGEAGARNLRALFMAPMPAMAAGSLAEHPRAATALQRYLTHLLERPLRAMHFLGALDECPAGRLAHPDGEWTEPAEGGGA